MTKFHINGKGVPAPCHAKKGNCPLAGSEGHFDNVEEAQLYADKVNSAINDLLPKTKSKNGVLSKRYKVTISQEAFDDVFVDSWNEHGYQVTGYNIQDELNGDYAGDPNIDKVYNALPQEIKDLAERQYVIIIKEGNIRDEIANNVISQNEYEGEGYESMIKTIEEKIPTHIRNQMISKSGVKITYDDFKEDLIDFATDKVKRESQLTMNGQKMYVATAEHTDRDFAKEYFESGRYKDFLNKQ